MAYTDAHRYRLGVNYETLPVNQPHAPVNHYQRDGYMSHDGNFGSAPNYEPNSMGGPVQDPSVAEPPFPVDGAGDRYDHREGNDDYTQPGNLFRLMTADEKARLIENIVTSMKGIPQYIQERQIVHFAKADPEYGRGVAQGLGLEAPAEVSMD